MKIVCRLSPSFGTARHVLIYLCAFPSLFVICFIFKCVSEHCTNFIHNLLGIYSFCGLKHFCTNMQASINVFNQGLSNSNVIIDVNFLANVCYMLSFYILNSKILFQACKYIVKYKYFARHTNITTIKIFYRQVSFCEYCY